MRSVVAVIDGNFAKRLQEMIDEHGKEYGVYRFGKVRVYELAKELNTTSKRLMEKLAEINIIVKNHMSLLDEKELDALYRHIGVIRHDERKKMRKRQNPPRRCLYSQGLK